MQEVFGAPHNKETGSETGGVNTERLRGVALETIDLPEGRSGEQSRESSCRQAPPGQYEFSEESPSCATPNPNPADWFEAAPVACFAFKIDGTIVAVNHGGASLLGGERSALSGRPFSSFVAPSCRELFQSHCRDVIRTGQRETCELEIPRHNGPSHVVSLVSVLSRDGGSTCSVVYDITEEKWSEMALRGSESKYRLLFEQARALLDAIPGLMFTLDRAGVCLDYHGTATGAGSVSTGHFTGRHISDILPLRAAQAVWSHLQQAVITGRPQAFEYAVEASGQLQRFEGRIASFGSDRFLLIVHDVTLRKSVEADSLRVRNLESLGRLAGGIAHDFNNLLMAVGGYICLARIRVNPGDKTHELLSEAERMVLTGKALTGELMTFTSGRQQRKEVVQIDGLARKICEAGVWPAKIEFRYVVEPGIFPVSINEVQLGHAIRNMVTNAMEAMPGGGAITIRCSNVPVPPGELNSMSPGDYVRLSIEDEGPGIVPEDMERVFDPYFTTKEMGTRRGMGLGLTVCYSTVRRHGGYITVDSVRGKGSAFHVYLPAHRDCTIYPEPRSAPEERSVKGGRRILVMDDENEIRDVLGKMLAHMGYHVAEAADGVQALRRYREEMGKGTPFDAVILDLIVKNGMGGVETLKELLHMDPRVKAILSTGYAPTHADHCRYEDDGFAAVLAKPYDVRAIDAVLRNVIDS